MYLDSYLIYTIPAILLVTISQIWISSSYSRMSKIVPRTKLTGEQAAEKIIEGEQFQIGLNISGRSLSDHFDPRNNTVTLSTSAKNSSVADIAVSAHELGHVAQKYSKSILFNLRNGLVPIVNIGSNLGYILIAVGFAINLLQLTYIGLILFSSSALFALLTVPIEFDASKRAISFIKKYNLIEEENIPKAKTVLNAAGFTYVASLLTSLLNLLYFVSRVRRRN